MLPTGKIALYLHTLKTLTKRVQKFTYRLLSNCCSTMRMEAYRKIAVPLRDSIANNKNGVGEGGNIGAGTVASLCCVIVFM